MNNYLSVTTKAICCKQTFILYKRISVKQSVFGKKLHSGFSLYFDSYNLLQKFASLLMENRVQSQCFKNIAKTYGLHTKQSVSIDASVPGIMSHNFVETTWCNIVFNFKTIFYFMTRIYFIILTIQQSYDYSIVNCSVELLSSLQGRVRVCGLGRQEDGGGRCSIR